MVLPTVISTPKMWLVQFYKKLKPTVVINVFKALDVGHLYIFKGFEAA